MKKNFEFSFFALYLDPQKYKAIKADMDSNRILLVTKIQLANLSMLAGS